MVFGIFVRFWRTGRIIQNVANLKSNWKLEENYFFGTLDVKTSLIRNIVTSAGMKTKERKFSKYHTWILVEDQKNGIVGLSNFAQKQLDEFVFIELPSIGRECKINEPCGTLESIRGVIDLCSPVSGVVYEKSTVEDFPRLINESCYDKGWLYKLKITQLHELNLLMNEAEYEDFIKKNFGK